MSNTHNLDMLLKCWERAAIDSDLDPKDVCDLYLSALKARDRAYAPYSKFRVGASVQTLNGRIFTGCNVENSSFGATVCAERTAIFKAISEGETQISLLSLIADYEKPVPPCGLCRQVLSEFDLDSKVLMGNLSGDTLIIDFKDLFPHAFSLDQGS